MAQDRNGNNHKAAGRPDGGQFDRKTGQGADDDLATGDDRLPTPTAGELNRVADAIGMDADAFMLQLPDGTVAGCYVLDGKIARNAQIRVVRDGIIIAVDSIASLKRFKDDAKEVAQGYECGVTLAKFNDIKEGDIYEAFTVEEYRD